MNSAVDRVDLPQGVSIPRLGLGTWQLSGESCKRAVSRAFELGYRHVDTASGYRNEEAVGRALARVEREEVFVTTKVWRDALAPDDLRRSCEDSLRRLDTPYVDLLLVHWPNREIPIGSTVEGFQRLREEGKIRAWGVSNFTETHLGETLGHGVPATNQVELHPFFRQTALVEFCAARSIPLTAYSPIARGAVLDDPVLEEIGADRGLTAAQVALLWNARRGRIVIPKAGTPRHLEENLAALEDDLTEEEMRRIESLPERERLYEFDWSEFDR